MHMEIHPNGNILIYAAARKMFLDWQYHKKNNVYTEIKI